MNFDQVVTHLNQYQEMFEAFKDAKDTVEQLAFIEQKYSQLEVETSFLSSEVKRYTELIEGKKLELVNIKKLIQEEKEEAEKRIEEQAEQKIAAAVSRATEILQEARNSVAEQSGIARSYEEDAKHYSAKVEKAKKELTTLEEKIFKAKSQVASILGDVE